eukprot:CAMPEP_0175336288 /NCGR_PEP_ID=MMETSP0095-20121207/3732_1 /TAXON_ID=311494 /ORGANISM="Alexandrium monilatum, Strain CCMP3105" /LENGTH=69 /DNA_ID=CAMNT_0016633635 /DNA_START=42 /DNA_END=247 /DNA_ORIENTATION=+
MTIPAPLQSRSSLSTLTPPCMQGCDNPRTLANSAILQKWREAATQGAEYGMASALRWEPAHMRTCVHAR